VGKNIIEKAAYKSFLSSPHDLESTESEPVDTGETNASSFEEEKIEYSEIKKKSKLLSVKDFFYNNWAITIIGGVIVLIAGIILTLCISLNREQGVHGEKISTIEKNVDTLSKNNEEIKNNFNSFKEGFNIFKTETSKDLGFIKEELKGQKK
jgi:hypothetical protein